MNKELAQDIYNHLAKTNQAFCFVDGVIIDREYIAKVLKCSVRELKRTDIDIYKKSPKNQELTRSRQEPGANTLQARTRS